MFHNQRNECVARKLVVLLTGQDLTHDMDIICDDAIDVSMLRELPEGEIIRGVNFLLKKDLLACGAFNDIKEFLEIFYSGYYSDEDC